jgi:energy-converting hydrogenase Eha subunit H
MWSLDERKKVLFAVVHALSTAGDALKGDAFPYTLHILYKRTK